MTFLDRMSYPLNDVYRINLVGEPSEGTSGRRRGNSHHDARPPQRLLAMRTSPGEGGPDRLPHCHRTYAFPSHGWLSLPAVRVATVIGNRRPRDEKNRHLGRFDPALSQPEGTEIIGRGVRIRPQAEKLAGTSSGSRWRINIARKPYGLAVGSASAICSALSNCSFFVSPNSPT
jgi:hypothetical protein